MTKPLTLYTRGLKVNTLIPPDSLPANLVPPEPKPAGNPVIDVALEGGSLVVRAVLNGKSVRRALKQIAEHEPTGVNVLLQGNLKPPASPGGPFLLDCAGVAVTPKAPKPAAEPTAAEPAPEPAADTRRTGPLRARMSASLAEAERRPIRSTRTTRG